MLISSSISALDQVHRAEDKPRKYFWYFLMCLGALMATYQMSALIDSYIEDSMSESEAEDLDASTFDVTLCTKDFNKTEFFKNILNNQTCKKDDINPSLHCLSQMAGSERYQYEKALNLNPPPNFNGTYLVFNNLVYGNCLTQTYNRRTTLTCNDIMKCQYSMFEILIVHETGTAPVFLPENIVKFNKFLLTYILIYVKNKIMEPQSWPRKNTCANHQTSRYANTSEILFNPLDSPIFSLSYEGCLDQCVHELTLIYCKCIRPSSMIETNTAGIPICTQYCNKIPQKKMEDLCQCKPSCQMKIYKTKKLVNYENEDAFLVGKVFNLQPLMVSLAFQINDGSPQNFINTKGAFVTPENKLLIPAQHVTAIVSTLRPSIQLESVLSCIGGIWGIWIGISTTVLIAVILDILCSGANHILQDDRPLLNRFGVVIMKKVVWNFMIITIILISFYQIYITLAKYFNHSVFQITTTQPQDPSDFPMPIVCSWSTFYVNEEELKTNPDLANKINLIKQALVPWRLNAYLTQLTDEDKKAVLPKAKDFIISCIYRTVDGKQYDCKQREFVTQFKNFFDDFTMTIKCVAINFNSGLASNIQELVLKLQYPKYDTVYYGYPMITNVILHPFSLYPFIGFFALKSTKVYPGDDVNIKYSMTETIRLPKPYPSECTNDKTYPIELEEFQFLQSDFNATYNYEICLQICRGKQTSDCYKMEKNQDECVKFIFPQSLESNQCGCKMPCKNQNYEFNILHDKYIYKKNDVLQRKYKDSLEFTDYLSEGQAVVRINSGSATKKILREKPAIEPFSLVGEIGGILGLWVGVSLLSLLIEIQIILVNFMKS